MKLFEIKKDKPSLVKREYFNDLVKRIFKDRNDIDTFGRSGIISNIMSELRYRDMDYVTTSDLHYTRDKLDTRALDKYIKKVRNPYRSNDTVVPRGQSYEITFYYIFGIHLIRVKGKPYSLDNIDAYIIVKPHWWMNNETD